MHKADLQPFDFEAMMSQEYDVTMYQPTLFCADSLKSLCVALEIFASGQQIKAELWHRSSARRTAVEEPL